MTHDAINPGREDAMAFLYVLFCIFIIISIAGKEAIAWLLMKLYEIFIQRNSVTI
jgi:hypothetical protein